MTLLTANPDVLCDAELFEAWRPPERLDPGDWAERHVTLPPDAPIKGRLDHRNAPYLPGMINIASRPGVAQQNIEKGGQLGVSTAYRWLNGFWAEQDPAPCGLTLPDKTKGRKIVAGYVLPFFRETKVLRHLMSTRSTDESAEQIRLLNGYTLHLMWAGSASSTSAIPLRRVVNDEVDKMIPWGRSGGEGHAVHRTKTRLRVFADQAIQINISTPTTKMGMIHRLVEDSDVILYFLVPCPHCGTRIRFVWSQVKIRHHDRSERTDNKQWAARVFREGSAWYECQQCDGVIDERARKAALQLGKWGTADEHGIADGVIEDAEAIEEWPEGTAIGMRIPALYATWESWPKLAKEYILAIGNLERMYTFITETLGEPFEQKIDRSTANAFSEMSKQALLPEGVVPWWAACLLATIDTQKDHFWLVIRAWGPGMRSARVFHGRVETFNDLDRLCFQTPWRIDGDRYQPMICDLALIDSGGTKVQGASMSRTMQVYAWALEHPAQVRSIKGHSKPLPGQFYKRGRGWFDPGDGAGEQIEVPLWLLDVHHYQDELASLMRQRIVVGLDDEEEEITEPAWMLNQRDDPDYNTHMGNLQKIAERRGGELVELWRPINAGARVDLRDCEGYQIAAAYMHHVHLLPNLEDFEAMRQAEIQIQSNLPSRSSAGGITMPDGRDFFTPPR